MCARFLIPAAGLILLAMAPPVWGQYVDPTNPEGSPMVGRFPGSVIQQGAYPAYGAGGIGYESFGAGFGAEAAQAVGRLDSVSTQALENYEKVLDITLQATKSNLDAAYKDPSNNAETKIDPAITHQPLIHIKVRVVEVQRTDNLAVSSVLDFITREGGKAPFGVAPFDANSINDDKRRFSGLTKFPVDGLINTAGDGAGMLVNLTSAHINWVASFLASELNADTITAPQVTTTNGKNVTFRAGSWIPFGLGRNFIQGDTNTVQEVFYRHVGTYVSVTPQIVNWDKNHEGLGRIRQSYATVNPERVLVRPQDILNTREAIRMLLASYNDPDTQLSPKVQDRLQEYLDEFNEEPDPDALKTLEDKARADLVGILNGFIKKKLTRSRLKELLGETIEESKPLPDGFPCEDCNWKPSDCTINLNLSVRLSDPGESAPTVDSGDPGAVVPLVLSSEQNVRAISNVVQVKSGHGVVLGGLITMQDVDVSSKVPVIGDIPIIGAALRSKETARIKTETLIFLEAEVLPGFDEPCYDECLEPLVKSKTAQDFCDSKVHIQGDLCDGPLAQGLRRAGLQGEYLPHPSRGESEYWRYYHQEMRRQAARQATIHVSDTFE